MDFELQFSDKEISAWGGMGLMKRMLDHLDFDATLRAGGCLNRAVIAATAPSN